MYCVLWPRQQICNISLQMLVPVFMKHHAWPAHELICTCTCTSYLHSLPPPLPSSTANVQLSSDEFGSSTEAQLSPYMEETLVIRGEGSSEATTPSSSFLQPSGQMGLGQARQSFAFLPPVRGPAAQHACSVLLCTMENKIMRITVFMYMCTCIL